MNATIQKAIHDKKLLELRYHNYSRLIEAYAYGRNKDGEEILRCYQLSGGSGSGEREGWKILKVAEIFSLHLIDNKFEIRPEYKKNDSAMIFIFSQH